MWLIIALIFSTVNAKTLNFLPTSTKHTRMCRLRWFFDDIKTWPASVGLLTAPALDKDEDIFVHFET